MSTLLIIYIYIYEYAKDNIYVCILNVACVENAVLYGLVSVIGLGCMYSCLYRSRLRVQYDLEEEPCQDCLVHFCCEPCALCQEYRELHNRGFDMGIGIYILLLSLISPLIKLNI